MKIVIAGAGMGGLAAAICCARAGHEVTVVEKNHQVGGKLRAHSAAGFTFDCGPSLLVLPTVLRELCAEQYDTLQINPLEEICHYFWDDGTEITSHSVPEVFAANIARATEDSEERYLSYFAQTKKLFKRIAPLFLTRDIHHRSLVKSALFWRSIPHIPLDTSVTTLHAYNRRYFRSPKTQQIFDRFATYAGSSPYKTAAAYSLISFIEHGSGAHYSAAGMRAIPQVLRTVAEQHGARIMSNERIHRIDRRTIAQKQHIVSTHHRSYECDALIANIDALQLDRLLGAKSAEYALKLKRRSTSAIVYLWGVNSKTDRFGLHNILFSDNYREEFTDIFTHHIAPRNPTIYVNISSKKIPTDAPAGMENWFVMVNVPARVDQDWHEIAQAMRTDILRRISRLCQTDIASRIVYEKLFTPIEFAHTVCDEYGSLYGMNAHGPLAALRRPGNTHSRYPHLYRCGGTTHPGGGVPLSLLSGCIAANRCSPQSISSPELEYLAIP